MSKQLFLVQLTYLKELQEIDQLMKMHVSFLKKYYKQKKFIVSGRQIPRKGGIIVCYAETADEVNLIMSEDPFKIYKAARYKITPFLASMCSPDFGKLLENL